VEGFAFGAEEAAGDALGAVVFHTLHAVAVTRTIPGAGTVFGENRERLLFHNAAYLLF
jgi:hypothetical protein